MPHGSSLPPRHLHRDVALTCSASARDSAAARRRVSGVSTSLLLLALQLAGCVSDTSVQIAQPSVAQHGSSADQVTPDRPKRSGDDSLAARVIDSARALVEERADLDARLAAYFAQARQLVEQNTNTDLSSVRLVLASEAAINNEVASETQRLINNQFNNAAFAQHFLDSVMSGQSGSYAALYATGQKAVMVSRTHVNGYLRSIQPNRLLSVKDKHQPVTRENNDHGQAGSEASAHIDADQVQLKLERDALMSLLIHELVHAADDQRYAIHDNRTLNFRASFAQSATFEGHAQWLTRKICAEAGCLGGLATLDTYMFGNTGTADTKVTSVQAISRNVLEYSYVEGERFVTQLARQPNGAAAIDALLKHPPVDPLQILAPERFPDHDRDSRNERLIEAVRNLDHPWLQGNWAQVETSPLKGVNLRDDPTRRQAAVDGFTRLIVGMVALQLHDQNDFKRPPIEVTLMQAITPETGGLFARTLHGNTRTVDAHLATSRRMSPGQLPVDLYVTDTSSAQELNQSTVIAHSGAYVVQINGEDVAIDLMEQFALMVIDRLHPPG